ncbi:prephenate dehydratase [Varunaivibrio sulfuroxidans]|uniref:prephenate dehydratase n=1 Tax=Varunaivibrio sulfuroxidans TaxID=1773489 RepID=A0A4R3JGI4_9PROT|nr:prephenate dehydratase [Varunaivibrio sulfuroxidans]TCS65032.1 prephenate dehydratase [Varunaivibrio sulfuroxidans]WES29678.1 prephenate dehydratase [Varunaivibrio sulfuroxidans]
MADAQTTAANTIAFQGAPGANSDLACRSVHPDMNTLPCATFEDTIAAVHAHRARLAMIPIENTVAGRVADIHHLLPNSGLHIIAEHFQRIDHYLLGVPGATIDELTHVHSHVHALNQCRRTIRALGVSPVVHADTAGAAEMIAQRGDKSQGAISAKLAGEIYGLDVLRANIEDAKHNTTRFLIMAREAQIPDAAGGPAVTSFVFRVKSVPAALYKALGGFATNGVNMTKLESYLVGGSFQAAQFYAEVEGHPEEKSMRLAFEELDFFTHEMAILGVYPAAPFRETQNNSN